MKITKKILLLILIIMCTTIVVAYNSVYDDTNYNENKIYNVSTIDTGQGDNELYDMNQNVETTSNVTFNNVTITECLLFESGGKICSGS